MNPNRAATARATNLTRCSTGTVLAVLIGLLPVASRPAAARTDHSVPTSITSDCSVDVTKHLNRWIDSVPDQATLRLRAGGCYRIEKSVVVKNRHGLTLEGNGATFRAFTDGSGYVDNVQTRNHVFLWGGSDLVIRDLRVQGVNTDHRYHAKYAGQRGFRIAGVQGVLLERVKVVEVRGDFVELDPDYYQTWRWSSDVTITDSVFEHSGRQGISITGARRVTIRNNRISGVALSVFDLEPDSGTSRDREGYPTFGGAADVRITGNDVGPGGLLFFGNVVTNLEVVTKNVVIENNRLRGLPLTVWSVGHKGLHYKNFTIAGNTSDTIYGGPRGAVELVYVDGAIISGNKTPFYADAVFPMTAVKTWGSSDVMVSTNRFPGADRVLQVDKARFGSPWRGASGGPHTTCGNRFGLPAGGSRDAPCEEQSLA